MSFSSKVKQEVAAVRHCRIAELAAIVDIHGETGDASALRTDNSLTKSRFNEIIQTDFGGDITSESVLLACRSGHATNSECCKRAYIRSAFLCAGTMADPKKAYHMEFAANPHRIEELWSLLAFFGLSPKIHLRKSAHIVYLKEAEQISTVLNIMGAHVAMMEFENRRVDKDVNNSINRVSNALDANEDKVIKASTKHIVDIMDLQRLGGMSSLSDGLAEVAALRLDNPLASLEDIGKMLSPPISKSGVNHRLRKIGQIADKYRRDAH